MTVHIFITCVAAYHKYLNGPGDILEVTVDRIAVLLRKSGTHYATALPELLDLLCSLLPCPKHGCGRQRNMWWESGWTVLT